MAPPILLARVDTSRANQEQAEHDGQIKVKVHVTPTLTMPPKPVQLRDRRDSPVYAHPELRLVRRDANHAKDAIRQTASNPECRGRDSPDFEILVQFSKYPLLSNAPLALRGYFHHAAPALRVHVPSDIISLCERYLFAEQDGCLQVAYTMFCILRKANRSSISRKWLALMLKAYLKVTDAAKLESYCNQLVRFNYLKPIGSNATSYQFSIEARLLFSEYHKQYVRRIHH